MIKSTRPNWFKISPWRNKWFRHRSQINLRLLWFSYRVVVEISGRTSVPINSKLSTPPGYNLTRFGSPEAGLFPVGGHSTLFQLGMFGSDFRSVGLAWEGLRTEILASGRGGFKWTENFQNLGLVSWEFPDLEAWELKFRQKNWSCRARIFSKGGLVN